MRSVVLSGVLLAAAVTAGQAQVGYEPSESPYRDITKRKSLTVMVGYFGGSGGAEGSGSPQRPDGRWPIRHRV